MKPNEFEGLTLTEMRAAVRMNIATKAFNKSTKNNRKKIHGDSMSHSKHHYLYDIWYKLKRRCNSRVGTQMYKPWTNNYLLFKSWILNNLGERKKGYFICLVNVNGNYIPGNIKWETRKFK